MQPTLSVCLIVKNEELDLARCLSSLRQLRVHEIVVVDTGSTDRTREIAAEFGARVFEHQWRNDFAAARNVGLELAVGDWILSLDADDALPPETVAQIPELIRGADEAQPPVDGYIFTCHSFMPPGDVVAFTELPVLRLFRNRSIYRYRQAIHEQILPSLYESGARVVRLDARILHYGYARSTVQGGEPRDQRDRAMLEAALIDDPDNVDLLFQLGGVAQRQGRSDEAQRLLQRALDHGDGLGPIERSLTHFYLSCLALQIGDGATALAHAEASIQARTHASPSMAWLNLAAAHMLLAQSAAEATTRALQPNLAPDAYSEALKLVHVSRGHFAQAQEAYRVVAAAPDLTESVRRRAMASIDLCAKMLR